MEKRIPVVVFTGAGASRAEPIKLPTMTEFFQRIMDNNRKPKSLRISDPDYFKFIFDTLYGNDQNYDLERVMGALYGLKDFTDNDCWKIFQHPVLFDNIIKDLRSRTYSHVVANNIQHSIDNIRQIMEQSTIQTYDSNKNKAKELIFDLEWEIRETYENIPNEHIRIVYEPLFDVLIKNDIISSEMVSPTIPFFTTNYDMSIDWFFDPLLNDDTIIHEKWKEKFNKEIKFIDGFSKRGWDKKEYEQIIEEQRREIFIPYFKLHGSLFWEEVAGRVRLGTNTANDRINPKNLMLVYPSDKKELYDDPYNFNHRQLDKYLRRADILLIIGFSFRDPGIVKAFENASIDNRDLKFVVVSPSEEKNFTSEMALFMKNNNVIHIQERFGTKEAIDKIKEALGNTCDELI